MTKSNTPAKATIEKVAGQLGVVPRRASEIARAANLSPSVTRRCLVVLAAAGRATKSDEGEWTIVKPDPDPKPSRKPRAKPVAPKPAEAATAEPDVPDAEYDTVEARSEWRELKTWQDGDQKGDRPDTPNLDAMNKAHAAGQPKRRKPKGNGESRSKRSPRGQEALERQRKLKNHRGKGRKVTDDELTDHVRKARQEHPDSSCYDEEEYAYWIVGIAVGRARWTRVWASLDAEIKSAA